MRCLLGLILFLCFAGASSRADSFQAFSFNATLTDSGTTTGTLTLDETTGLFTAVNLSTSFLMLRPSVPSSYIFNAIDFQGDVGAGSSDDPYRVYFNLDLIDPQLSNPDDLYRLNLLFQNSSLVGYGVGSVCFEASDCFFSLENSAFLALGN